MMGILVIQYLDYKILQAHVIVIEFEYKNKLFENSGFIRINSNLSKI